MIIAAIESDSVQESEVVLFESFSVPMQYDRIWQVGFYAIE